MSNNRCRKRARACGKQATLKRRLSTFALWLALDHSDDPAQRVLDWELCTIGEPLADLAYSCIWHHLPGSAFHGLTDRNPATLGIPSEDELIARYEKASGITAAPTRTYFLAFAFYRLAAILQGVYRRALNGNAASPQALARGAVATLCLDHAARLAAE